MFKDLDEAIEALKYRTYDFVRQQAAEELSKSDDPRAIEALIHSIENDISWVVRAASIDALVKIGNDTAIPTILKAIDNELVGVQYQAVKAFQHFKDKSAIPKIVKNLKNSKHIHFRKLAAETLEILGWSSEDPLEKAIITASKGVWDHTILKETDEEIVLDLIKMYVEDEHFWEMYYESETYFDETEIYPAVSYLGKIKGKESYNLFIKVFDKLESYDQRYLVSNFSSIGTKKDIPRLMEYIEKVILDDDELWDSKAGVDAIKEILADESEAFFKQEIDSRIRTSDRTEQFLIRVFLQGLDPESESTKDYLKKYLIQGPSFVKESILYRLIDEREERDVSVLSLLLEQLQRGEESLQVSKAMLIVLRISKDEKLIEPFLELLSKASLELKKEIVLTLGYFEDKRVIQVLQDYLHHKDKELVKWVCLSLRKLKWEPKTEEESKLYYFGIEDWKSYLSIGESAFNEVSKKFDTLKTHQRSNFISCLVHFFDIYPLKNILTKALKDKEERVRASAVSVIQDKPSLVNKSDILKAWKKEDSYARRNYEYLMTKLDSISEKDEHTEDDLVFWISSKNINKINEFARNNLSSLKPYITGEDYNTKRLIAQSLRNIDDPKIYEMLGILLLDEDKETSLAALECLTAYKTEKAIDTMLLAIKNGANYQVEYKAVDSLESFGTFAVPIIIKKIKNMDDSKSKQCIAASLGRIGDEQAVDVLYDMMINDEARLVRLYSAQALKKIGWKPKDKSEEILFLLGAEKFKELVEFGEEAAEVLLRELRSEKDYIRSFIIDTLGDIGSKSAVKTLVNYAKFNKRDRTTTLEALTKIGHSLDVDTLLMFMNDSYDVLRQRAVYNAGHSKDPIIYEELIKFLKDKDKGVRYAAAFSLGDIGNKKAIPHLIKALKDDNEIVQDHSIRSLGVLKAKEAISVLIPFLDHNGYSMRNRTIWALGEIGEKKSIQKIEKFLDDPYDLVRRQTILSLGKLKSKKSISKIKELLEDKHEEVRKAAAEVIAELERS